MKVAIAVWRAVSALSPLRANRAAERSPRIAPLTRSASHDISLSAEKRPSSRGVWSPRFSLVASDMVFRGTYVLLQTEGLSSCGRGCQSTAAGGP